MTQDKRVRGVYEKVSGSGIWWIRYVDADGRLRREVAGTKSVAAKLYQKRKVQALEGRKLPETLRQRTVSFSELADDAIAYTKANNAGHSSDTYRLKMLREEFGSRPAESIPIDEFRTFFESQEWEPGTYNRVRTVLFSLYRLGMENKKVASNPAKVLKRHKVSDDRVRFLDQFDPLPTRIDYLLPLETEEARLRAVIQHDYPDHMEELDIALHTGMRRSEQYLRIDWSCVDLPRKDLTLPTSKTGDGRHIPLNAEARGAFERLRQRTIGKGPIPIAPQGPIFVGRGGERLQGPRHWFEDAVEKAGLRAFSWHCLRHTFASRLAMQGVDIRTIAELMGHKRIQMTMRYAHLAPEHKLVAVERLNAYIH